MADTSQLVPFGKEDLRVTTGIAASDGHFLSNRSETSVRSRLVTLEETRSRLTHRVNDQRAIQKEIPCFATCLCDQKTAMTRCPMQHPVFIGSNRVVIGAYRIAGTEALPFESGLENSDESPCDLDETAQCALIASGGRVDQDTALNGLPRNSRQHIDALLQSTCRVAAIDRHLARRRRVVVPLA